MSRETEKSFILIGIMILRPDEWGLRMTVITFYNTMNGSLEMAFKEISPSPGIIIQLLIRMNYERRYKATRW